MPQPTRDDLTNAVLRLGLQLDGDPFRSLSSLMCLVTHDGRPAFLKVTNQPEDLVGARALKQWGGNGAVRVLVRDGNAILLERAGNTLRSLVTDDASATQVLCVAAQRLHANRPKDLDGFPTLRTWFCSLFDDARPRFDQVKVIAAGLLDHSTPPVLLHGDLHHENVVDGGDRGWLAIDPKGIVGAREFDYCNIFTNWTLQDAVGHFDARLELVARAAHIDRIDLLRWIASWSALSGIWHLEDGDEVSAALPHSIMELALDRLQVHDA